jgi:hypothetical protein
MLKCLNPGCGKEFLYAAKRNATVPVKDEEYVSIETHICPYCESRDIHEVEETQSVIESMKQVTYEEVDKLLKEGYEVKDTYATKVTMVKKAKETK